MIEAIMTRVFEKVVSENCCAEIMVGECSVRVLRPDASPVMFHERIALPNVIDDGGQHSPAAHPVIVCRAVSGVLVPVAGHAQNSRDPHLWVEANDVAPRGVPRQMAKHAPVEVLVLSSVEHAPVVARINDLKAK